MFIDVGERILIYDLDAPQRITEDIADTGFWAWERYKDFVIMSAKLEISCWNINGNKMWSTFVEPPYNYKIIDNRILLDIMGEKSSFDIKKGPNTYKKNG